MRRWTRELEYLRVQAQRFTLARSFQYSLVGRYGHQAGTGQLTTQAHELSVKKGDPAMRATQNQPQAALAVNLLSVGCARLSSAGRGRETVGWWSRWILQGLSQCNQPCGAGPANEQMAPNAMDSGLFHGDIATGASGVSGVVVRTFSTSFILAVGWAVTAIETESQ